MAQAAAAHLPEAADTTDEACFWDREGRNLTLCVSTLLKRVEVPYEKFGAGNSTLRRVARINPFSGKPLQHKDLEDLYESILTKTVKPLSCPSLKVLRRILFARGAVGSVRGTLWKAMLGYIPQDSYCYTDCPTPWNRFRRLTEEALEEKRMHYTFVAKKYREIIFGLYKLGENHQDRILYNDIAVDLPRTIIRGLREVSDEPTFRRMVGRIIFTWAHQGGNIGYFQGLIDLAYMFLVAFLGEHPKVGGDYSRLAQCTSADFTKEELENLEADVYWCLTTFMDYMEKCFSVNLVDGVEIMVEQLGNILAVSNPKLWTAMVSSNVQLNLFAFRWMVCLLVRDLSLENAMMLWDAYMALGPCFPRFHIYVCAALISNKEADILGRDVYDVINVLNDQTFKKCTPSKMRAVIDQAVVLSQHYPFADDPTRDAKLEVLPGRLSTEHKPTLCETLTQMLADVMRAVVSKEEAGDAAAIRKAKHTVACMVVLAAVCLVCASAVMAVRWCGDDDNLDTF